MAQLGPNEEGAHNLDSAAPGADAWDAMLSRRRALALAAGATASEADADAARIADLETASTWSLVEVAGCSAAHPLPTCSRACFAEGEDGWVYRAPFSCPEHDPALVGLRLTAALERVGRREAALAAIARACARAPADPRVRLARAKLLFRSGRKGESEAELVVLTEAWKAQCGGAASHIDRMGAQTAGDAWYIRGWVAIHRDDHTAAYAIWGEGAALLPSDVRLTRQMAKVQCWARLYAASRERARVAGGNGGGTRVAAVPAAAPAPAAEAELTRTCTLVVSEVINFAADGVGSPTRAAHEGSAAGVGAAHEGSAAGVGAAAHEGSAAGVGAAAHEGSAAGGGSFSALVGLGAHGDGVFCPATDALAFTVPACVFEPALALFDPGSQARAVAFLTVRPLLTRAECSAVLSTVSSHVDGALGGVWGTVRRSSVPTTDIAVEDVPALRPWLRALLASRMFPFLAACFPRLADGRTLTAERLRVHDAFIVRYDSDRGSTSLPEHSDTSVVSVSLALNEGGGVDYDGGGTWIRSLRDTPCGGVLELHAGHALGFAGPLRHGGHAIRSGVRVILVLFCYVEGFAYGELLGHSKRSAAAEGTEAAAAATARKLPVGGGELLEEGKGATDQRQQLLLLQQQAQPGFVVYRETVGLMEALQAEDEGAE